MRAEPPLCGACNTPPHNGGPAPRVPGAAPVVIGVPAPPQQSEPKESFGSPPPTGCWRSVADKLLSAGGEGRVAGVFGSGGWGERPTGRAAQPRWGVRRPAASPGRGFGC